MKKTYSRFVKNSFFVMTMLGFSEVSFADPATITRGTDCPVIDANGVLFIDADARLLVVQTPSGNILATCKGQLPAGAAFPSRAIRWNEVNFGVDCIVAGDSWQMVVTPSGQTQLVCHARL